MPLSRPQAEIATSAHRFKVIIAGRRFGKTFLSIRQLCYYAREPDRTVWYVAPTYRQAKMIAFKALKKRLLELRWVRKINETELTFELKNGSTISLKGADNYDSLRGIGLDYLVLDEFADIDPEAWYETLRPTLADRKGGALFIGTPKGLNWAHDLYNMPLTDPEEWISFQFTTLDGGNVTESEILAAQKTMDIRTFRQEFLATFENFSGRVYYAFDRKENVKSYADELPKELHIGMDFNVSPICAIVAVRRGNELHIIDEIKIYESNTDELVDEIKVRYGSHNIICYPDPAGSARKTSAGTRTDHTILRTAGFRVIAPHAHNPVRDGINAVNAKLCSSAGIRTLWIDPKCKYTIECLERHVYKEGTQIPDKDSGYDHMTDALRYMTENLFPIRQPVTQPSTRMWTHKIG